MRREREDNRASHERTFEIVSRAPAACYVRRR
jgi:hypothetical protein